MQSPLSELRPENVRQYPLRILAFGVLLAILYYGRVFLITAIIAVMISFILEPFVRLLMRARLRRSMAAVIVLSIAGLVIYGTGLGIYTQTAGLIAELPQLGERVGSLVDAVRQKVSSVEDSTFKLIIRQPPPPAPQAKTAAQRRKTSQNTGSALPAIQEVRIHQDSNPLVDFVYPRLGSVYEFMLMASFVPFLVYFMLSWGDHLNRNFLQLFHGENRVIAAKSLMAIGEIVRAFVVGNFLLGVLIASVSALAFWMISVPFPLLSATLSGFLSLVPYVGLPLAMVPPVVAGLGGAMPLTGIALIVLVVAGFHLLAINLLYPKLVGSRVHLNPLIVTLALMFWGFFWNAAGLILAIPITAAIKAICDNVPRLRSYGRFLGN